MQNTYLRRDFISCTIQTNDNTEVDEPGLSLNKLYAGRTASNTTNYFHTQKDLNNVKAVRFLTKQENWLRYAKAGVTNFAIGTPSLELDVASLKAHYPSNMSGLSITLSTYNQVTSYSYNNSNQSYKHGIFHEYGSSKDIILCSPFYESRGYQYLAYYYYNGWMSSGIYDSTYTRYIMPTVSIPTSYVKERNNSLVVEIPE